jgi:hypothetical protein
MKDRSKGPVRKAIACRIASGERQNIHDIGIEPKSAAGGNAFILRLVVQVVLSIATGTIGNAAFEAIKHLCR